uniref:Heme chaperone HemW n=1 Tax=Thermodesulfovibrio aggregans TaxID=86166 RepID=A0A7C4AJJ5_9BACT
MGIFFSSLYVHVPFCIKKCKYCNFYSLNWSKELEKLYITAVIKEIKLTTLYPHSLKTIYIGGGTPSCLSIPALKKLLCGLLSSYKLKSNIEFSVELNPATVDEKKLKLMKYYGVNRLSIGVQSFNDEELSVLGRLHTSDEAHQTVKLALKAGFENISIDLIYGIPGQTLKSWKQTLNRAVNMDIKHISVYELNVEKNTPLKKEINSGKILLPSEQDIVKMYEYATEFLETKGFKKYEISNFARTGFQCKHNIAYWTVKQYLGVGPGAHSFIDKKRFHNPDLFAYSKTLSQGKHAWINDSIVDRIERLKERIFLGLRMKKGVSLKQRCLIELFKEFENPGLAKISNNKVSLTNKGMLVSNEVFARVLLHIENCPACKQG